MSNAVFVISPVLGGYLSTSSIRSPVAVAILVCVVNFLLVCSQPDDRRFDVKTPKKVCAPSEMSSNRQLQFQPTSAIGFDDAISLKFVFQLGNMIYDAFYSQMLHDRLHFSAQSIGWLFSLSGIVSSFTNAYLVPRFYYQHDLRLEDALILASLAQAIGLWLWGRTQINLLSALMSTMIVSMSSNVFLTLLQHCIAVSPSMQHRGSGTTLSLSSTVDRAARSIAPFIGGLALQQIRSTSIGSIAAVSALSCSIILITKSSSSSHSKLTSTTMQVVTHSFPAAIWIQTATAAKELGFVSSYHSAKSHR
jgi:predicted MFS family arabinose efflux permease